MRVRDDKRLYFDAISACFFEGALVTFSRSGTELVNAIERGINQLAAVHCLVTAGSTPCVDRTHLDMLRISGLNEPYIGIPRSRPSSSPSVIHKDKISFSAVTPLTKDI
jgi:hypothetical protein